MISVSRLVMLRRMSTFKFQSTLPKLPIPPLAETLDRYVKSVQPLQTPAAHAQTKAHAASFLKDLGPVLQGRLEKYAGDKANWLEDWWFRYAYHSWRTNVLIHSNWFMLLSDHPTRPAALQDDSKIYLRNGAFTPHQIERAAYLISNLCGYISDLVAYGFLQLDTRANQPGKRFLSRRPSRARCA